MVGLIQRRPTIFRRTGEMSRWRRLCTRRYFLGNAHSEERLIYYIIRVVNIFYMHSVVGNVPNLIHVIYGGGIRRTRRYSSVHTPLQKNTLETHCSQGIFIIYFTLNSSLKWMNNAALEEATNRGVLVNTSQVGSFWKAS